ncbi:MAG: acyl-CoA dehydrogenase [Rhodospirillaceae bacterium]|nr:acyl-CoA dehydrogenase [Rhodospirillaceae bacterium]|tara:strand:- start:3158 stop:4222 length:1065 start_codon:yes stop_codon:yes gene_type:complete
MREESAAIGDMAARLFADLADPQEIVAGKEGWLETLWTAIEDAALDRAWVAEEQGGAGLDAVHCGAIAAASGGAALAAPLIETMVARHWASRAGLDLPDGPVGLAPSRLGDVARLADDGTLIGTLRDVPWSKGPLLVAAEQGDGSTTLCVVTPEDCRIREQPNLSDDPRVAVALDGVTPRSSAPTNASRLDVLATAAVLRAAQVGGALRWATDAVVDYAGKRQAFGRTISRFQAVQHLAARLAGEVCAVEVAARVALQAIDRGEGIMEAACAKVRADEAAEQGAQIAHQVFGAIGFTREHVLHRYTTRLGSWRDDYGAGPEWAILLGHAAAANGGAGYWNSLAGPDRLELEAGR